MTKNMTNQKNKPEFSRVLTENIEAKFAEALEQVIPHITTILTENLTENDQDEDANRQTTLTVQAKIRIDHIFPAAAKIQVTIPAKRIEKVVGEASVEFDLNQPNLPNVNQK